MDVRTIVKILAILAVVALVYKMWANQNQAPRGWVAYNDFEEDYETQYDVAEEDDDDAASAARADDSIDEEDDYEEDYEDASDAEDDYEVDIPSMSKLTLASTPMLSPSSKLLPSPSVKAQDFAQYAPKELGAQNFLTATQWIGVNTQGSSLRNANYDIRANPIIPKADVGPWAQSTIDPDVYMKPLF